MTNINTQETDYSV